MTAKIMMTETKYKSLLEIVLLGKDVLEWETYDMCLMQIIL